MSEPVKAPPGHIIDDQGNVRKVLGTLPITADGCVIAHDPPAMYMVGEKGWKRPAPIGVVRWNSDAGVWSYVHANGAGPCSPRDCYSTRAAAEAARGT
jgi:hypothetical protein